MAELDQAGRHERSSTGPLRRGRSGWSRRRQPNRGRHRAPQSGAGVAPGVRCDGRVRLGDAVRRLGSARSRYRSLRPRDRRDQTAEALDLALHPEVATPRVFAVIAAGKAIREARGAFWIVPCRRQRSGRTEDGGRRCPLTLVVRHRPHRSLGLRPGSQASVSLRSTPLQRRHRVLSYRGGTVSSC